MNTHKLTKSYYFPIVKGSQFGVMKIASGFKSALQTFLKGPKGSWTKVSNYSNMHNYFFDLRVAYRTGYEVYGIEHAACVKANRYLAKQYARLARALAEGNIEKYTAIWETLKDRSDLFLIVLFIRKLRFYSTNYSINKVKWMTDKIRKMLKTGNTNLKFRRVFLPEYNLDGSVKKYRPLGVPSVEWRVISSMYEFYLVNMFKKDWNPNQFACMPKVGVVDAWIQILLNIDSHEHVVGIDLAKFFDSVNIKWVKRALTREDVPDRIVDFLTKLNYCLPIIDKNDRRLEEDRIKNINIEAPSNMIMRDFDESPMDTWSPGDKTVVMGNSRKFGLPQGLNTSPLLACIALNHTKALSPTVIPGSSHIESTDDVVVQYVDDAVLMNNIGGLIAIEEYSQALKTDSSGMTISEKKTEMIKRSGKWLKPLKFLGCEYDGQTFKAHTRKGGIYEVKDASSKIQEIIKWLLLNRNSIQAYERRDLSQLIAKSWNHHPSWTLLDPNKDLSKWEKERIITTQIGRNSVEGKVISRHVGNGNIKLIGSTNTMSMLCAGETLISLLVLKSLSRVIHNTYPKGKKLSPILEEQERLSRNGLLE
jgi:hypothetical protein